MTTNNNTTTSSTPDLARYIADAEAWGADPDLLRPVLVDDVVAAAIKDSARSRQREIGPSQIGCPCPRWLAHFFAGTQPVGIQAPKWAAAIGTAVHDHFGAWCHDYNARHDVNRFLTDLRVHVGDLYPGRPISGTLDALDVWTGTIIDLKVPGPSQMQAYRPGQPESPVYDVQVDLYGNGCINAGFPVASVGILRLPRTGQLSGATWRARRHDPDRGRQALLRAGAIAKAVDVLGTDAIPLQPTAEYFCANCDYYLPGATDLTTACPGADSFRATRDTRVDAAKAACQSLIA